MLSIRFGWVFYFLTRVLEDLFAKTFVRFVPNQFSIEYMYDCKLLAAVSYSSCCDMTVSSPVYVYVLTERIFSIGKS